MDLILSQDVPNPVGIVQHYLTATESSREYFEERSRVAQMSMGCLFLLQTILKNFSTSGMSLSEDQKTTKISLQRSFGRLKLWSDEHSILEGSIDGILAESSSLEHNVLKILTSIGETLTERLIDLLDIAVDTACQESIDNIRRLSVEAVDSVSDGSSDSDRSAFSFDSLKEALEDLQMDTTCLLDLEPLLSDPIVLAEREPVRPDKYETWHPTQVYCDKISTRFPEADERLIQRLGNANFYRYLRCQETRNRMQSEEVLSNDVVKYNHDGASSKFHDSGIGSSLPTTYADTVMSYGDNEIRKVRLPPLPAHSKGGLPFACLCCGKLVSVHTNSAWKQHIYADLQPWVCLEIDCPKAYETFHTCKDWVSHLALDHGLESDWMSIKCPLCRHDTGPGKALVTKHLGSHLEEISLGALPVDCEFEEDTTQSELEILSTVSESCEAELGSSSSHVLNSWSKGAALIEKFEAQTSRVQSIHKLKNMIEQMEVEGRSSKEVLQALKSTVRNGSLDQELLGPKMRSYFDDVIDDLSLLKPGKECLSDTSWPIATEADRTSPCFPVSAPANAALGTFSLDTNFEPLPSLSISGAIQSGTDDDEHNEPRYCYCNRASFGEMVGCDGEDCKRQWFHLGCVGLKSAPSAHATWFCDECKAINSSALPKHLAPGKQRPDHLTMEKHDQVKALYEDTSQKENFLGDKHVRSSDKLDHKVPEEIELATSRSDMTTERRDSLTASERTVVSTADLASDDITDKQEGGRSMSLIDEPNYEASQVETARETRPMIGDPKERDEDLALHNHPDTGLLGVPGHKLRSELPTLRSELITLRSEIITLRSELPTLRSRRARTTQPKVKTGCYNCKQRRIKCDEDRPACSNCVRSKKICSGYPPPPPSARPEAQAAPNASE